MKQKELIVVGDRVLLKVDDTERRTEVGLYLPETVRDKEEVLGGTIVKTGLGIPLVDPSSIMDIWSTSNREVHIRYIPMEAKPGDYALFLRKASVELEYEGEKFLIVPQSAILLLIRETIPPAEEEIMS